MHNMKNTTGAILTNQNVNVDMDIAITRNLRSMVTITRPVTTNTIVITRAAYDYDWGHHMNIN